MKKQVIDTSNKKIKDISLPETLFAANVSPELIAQYVRVYRSNQRQGTNKVLHRGEITGTTAKVWRQKGTGRARHGSRKAPIFVGGGKAHGPAGNQNYTKAITKQMRRQAIAGALTSQLDNSIFVSGLEKLDAKTKQLNDTLNKILSWTGSEKVTIVLQAADLGIVTASKNLENVNVTQAHRLNAYEVLTSDKIIFTPESIEVLTNTFASKKEKAATVEVAAPKKETTTKQTTKAATK